MVRFLDPETAEILQFLDPEIVKMDKKNSGSRNLRNGVISGSINCRKGRQILYEPNLNSLNLNHMKLMTVPLDPFKIKTCTRIMVFIRSDFVFSMSAYINRAIVASEIIQSHSHLFG